MNPEDHPYLTRSNFYGIRFGLKTMETTLKSLGFPQKAFETVHVAGTNGKGSTARMIAEALTQCGHKTGLYTSPHIQRITERFQINGREISAKKLNDLFSRLEKMEAGLAKRQKIDPMTYFEICTAAAFLWFKEEGVRFAVIETGMGGRLDATNVVRSKYVVITSIGLDHQKFLGQTLGQIAQEKAAIIHGKAQVILGKIPGTIIQDIRGRYPQARFFVLEKDFLAEKKQEDFVFRGKGAFDGLSYRLNLQGDYQKMNSAMAIQVLGLMKKEGTKIDPMRVKQSLSKVIWKGRFDLIRENPTLILDAAHNVPAVKELIKSLKTRFPDLKFTCICGFCSDKNYLAIIKWISQVCERILLIPFDSPRNVPPETILKRLKSPLSCPVEKAPSFIEAIAAVGSSEPVLACGSFYVLEQAYNFLEQKSLNIMKKIKARE